MMMPRAQIPKDLLCVRVIKDIVEMASIVQVCMIV